MIIRTIIGDAISLTLAGVLIGGACLVGAALWSVAKGGRR